MKVDVIVVGGGLVGLATALLLSQSGFEIALIDALNIDNITKTETLSKTSPYELRVSAITPQTIQLFKKLAIWEDIKNFRVGYFNKIKIWECAEDNSENNPLLFSAQGYIIENNIIQNILLSHIKDINKNKNNINIFAPVTIQKIQKTAENINILLDNNINITAKLIIGADGANSKIREWAELGLNTQNYNQAALVGIIQTQFSHENIARQRFLPNGPLAFLPMAQQNYCSIVWTNIPEETHKLLQCEPEEFNKILEKNWGKAELGELKLVGPRAVFNLSKKHAKSYISDRVVLVGDAAHVIHPLAGQGVNLGFLDAQKLAEVLNLLKKQNRDIGLFNNLRKYELARKGDNIFMQNMMDIFNKAGFRKLGIKLVGNNNFLKKLMVYWTENRGEIV